MFHFINIIIGIITSSIPSIIASAIHLNIIAAPNSTIADKGSRANIHCDTKLNLADFAQIAAHWLTPCP